jgi:phosphatidyl-myo-inositol dimannoside synthase
MRSGKPRLLVLTPDFPPAHGGVQIVVHRLARAMKGFQTEVVTFAQPGADGFDSAGELATRRVAHCAWAHRASVVALNATALRRALRFRPDVTLSAHIVTSPAAAVVRRLLGARTVQYFWAIEVLDKPRLSAFAAKHADIAIALSNHAEALIAATGAPTANVRLIPPGVDLPSESGALHAERPTVLTIAALKYGYKGHDVLIRALARVRGRIKDLEWVVIGEGPLRSRLEELASLYGLADSTRFRGEVADEQRNAWLQRCDVFAMPSRLGGEGFGIVYLEANAYGKPVVAGNVGGAIDAVADGVSGLLVDPTDAAAVADALKRLLLDRELAQRLGRAGAIRARDFAWPAIAGRVEETVLALAEAA